MAGSSSMIYAVSNQYQLAAAVKVATGGDVISLSAGTYSDVSLKSLTFSGSPVTITSADPGNPAVIIDMTLTSVKGVNFENLTFRAGDGPGLTVAKSANITIDNVDFVGNLDNGRPGGNGLKIDQSKDVVVNDSDFRDLGYALTHMNSERVDITGNTFENIRVDGIRGGGTSWIEISGNTLRNFFRDPGEHPDAIQFWTNGINASAHDIVVKDNLIERGEGNRMQGIFFGDEARGKFPYLNVEISGNTVLGTMYHGISLYAAKGAVVSDNTVVGYDDMRSWIRLDNSKDVILDGNIATQITVTADSTNITRIDNEVVSQIPAALASDYVLAHVLRLMPVVETPPDGGSIGRGGEHFWLGEFAEGPASHMFDGGGWIIA